MRSRLLAADDGWGENQRPRTLDGGLESDAGASISLPLPDADLGTHMSRELPRYRELEVEAKGADPIRFLVPVYAP